MDDEVAFEIRRADEKAKAGRWEEAFPVYQRLLSDRESARIVFPLEAGWFIGIKALCRKRLLAMPEAARKAYRNRFDTLARTLFELADSSNDRRLFEKIADIYLLSSYGDDALGRLGDMAFERGSFEQALRYYERIRGLGPDTNLDPARLLLKSLVCALRLGKGERARAYLAALRKRTPELKVRLKGKSVSIPRLVEGLKSARGRADRTQEGGGFVWGGNNAHNGNPPFDLLLGKQLWRRRIRSRRISSWKAYPEFGRSRIIRRYPRGIARGQGRCPYQPAVASGKLLLCTSNSITTYSLENGKKLWEQSPWPSEYGDQNPNLFHTCTVDGGRVFSTFIHRVRKGKYWRHIPIKEDIPVRKLVAFDLVSGKQLWDLGKPNRDAFASEDDFRFVARASFPLPPVVRGDRLFVGATMIQGFVHCHLACFESSTGKLLWKTWLCSGQIEQTMFGEHAVEPLCTMVAEADGILYYSTSFGIVTAVRAADGEILWQTRYDQIEVEAARGYYTVERQIGWANTPPICWQGLLLVSPLDSDYYYAYDAHTGRMLWKAERRWFQYLVGVSDGTVVASGSRIWARDVRSGKLKWEALSGLTHWKTRSPMRSLGRGIIAGGSVHIPVNTSIFQLDLRSGKILSEIRLKKDASSVGNILLTERYAVLANPLYVTVFERPDTAQKGKTE
jgi:outer membrane protein assembly factor BamB